MNYFKEEAAPNTRPTALQSRKPTSLTSLALVPHTVYRSTKYRSANPNTVVPIRKPPICSDSAGEKSITYHTYFQSQTATPKPSNSTTSHELHQFITEEISRNELPWAKPILKPFCNYISLTCPSIATRDKVFI